jgi:hypothetical protein
MVDLSTAPGNHQGTGKDQYPPSMILGALIYCYAIGTFSTRRIERLRGAGQEATSYLKNEPQTSSQTKPTNTREKEG